MCLFLQFPLFQFIHNLIVKTSLHSCTDHIDKFSKNNALIPFSMFVLMQENLEKSDTSIWSNDLEGWFLPCRSTSRKYPHLQGLRGKYATNTVLRKIAHLIFCFLLAVFSYAFASKKFLCRCLDLNVFLKTLCCLFLLC